jgi:hypothetical protein
VDEGKPLYGGLIQMFAYLVSTAVTASFFALLPPASAVHVQGPAGGGGGGGAGVAAKGVGGRFVHSSTVQLNMSRV